ncbi:MAG: E3 binding domain-containing protein [Spirochaetaceae bacterium]|nr:E3 binding domain-containing protein [Spirochaetaceae bacterium]
MVEAVIPKLDETTEVATVERWLVQEGEWVEQGQPICEVETDKALVQVEAPAAGTLRRQLIAAGTEVPPLTIVALVGNPSEPVPEVDPYARTAGSQSSAPSAEGPAAPPSAAQPSAPASGRPIASPRARRLAEELGVDLGTVTGTGPGGKITDHDVQRAAGR